MMTLKEYIKANGASQLAKDAGTVPMYLYQISWGIKRPSLKKCRDIIEASGGMVTLESMNPEIAEDIKAILFPGQMG